MRFRVIARFKDLEAGCTRKPGDIIEADGERVARLQKAKVIGATPHGTVEGPPNKEEQRAAARAEVQRTAAAMRSAAKDVKASAGTMLSVGFILLIIGLIILVVSCLCLM